MTDDEIALLLDVVRTPEAPRLSLEERLQLMEDHRSIVDLVMAYGWLCDARRWDELLDLYTDDFERVLAGTLVERVSGKEKLRALYEAPALPRAGDRDGPPAASQLNTYELRHMIHPPVVRIGDDGASAVAAAVYSLVASSGDGADFRKGDHQGGYIFGFRREPVGWRFCTMTVISENARNPLFQA
ncbi:MAG: nuclear transport factor 2 family protein [Acidimicrobiales bacterium]|nr:nuclear transport factor 2 family protein [Acidimicrobiales bacterium]